MLRLFSIASAFTISHGLQIRVGPSVDSVEPFSENENRIPDDAVPAGGENVIAPVESAPVLREPRQHAEPASEVPERKHGGELTSEVPERKYHGQLMPPRRMMRNNWPRQLLFHFGRIYQAM